MNIINKFENDIQEILDKLNNIIFSYQEPFKSYGLKYLEKLHLLKTSVNKTCESYILIPYWLKSSISISKENCKQISLATILSVIYFLSQDEIFDDNSGEISISLMFSNTLFNEFTKIYYKIFPYNSIFWSYFYAYLDEWKNSVLWEKTNHVGKINTFSEDDLITLARKTSGIKIPFAAVCILSNNESYIKNFSRMVDHDQIVYQFFDDYRDWQKDLSIKNYTYFIVQCIKKLQIDINDKNVVNQIKHLVMDENFLIKYFRISYKHNQLALNHIKLLENEYLNEYINIEASTCILEPIRNLYKTKYNLSGFFEKALI